MIILHNTVTLPMPQWFFVSPVIQHEGSLVIISRFFFFFCCCRDEDLERNEEGEGREELTSVRVSPVKQAVI